MLLNDEKKVYKEKERMNLLKSAAPQMSKIN